MAKAAAVVAEQSEPKVTSADLREPPVIKSANVQVDSAGQIWRNVLVRMPEGAIADDLRDPKIFRVVQGTPQALVKMDRVLALGWDESWAAEGIVKYASNSEVRLLIHKVFGFADPKDGLYSDGVFSVGWDGLGYCVKRVKDQVVVARGFATEGAALDELKRQYARVVSR